MVMGEAKRYKNIDSILVNAAKVLTLGRLIRSCLPRISDEVVLKTNDECALIVRVSWISQDGATFRGIVTAGDYYLKEETEHIVVGELVEFSLKKISGVPTKVRRFPRTGQTINF
jgi:hypothetical protein